MTRDELLALMDHFSASVLYRMEYEEGDTRLVLEKAPPAPAVPLMAAAPAAVPAAAVAPAALVTVIVTVQDGTAEQTACKFLVFLILELW